MSRNRHASSIFQLSSTNKTSKNNETSSPKHHKDSDLFIFILYFNHSYVILSGHMRLFNVIYNRYI
jgi:hypothetical protein